MDDVSEEPSLGRVLKKAFPSYLVMRGVVLVVMMAVSTVGGFGWVIHTTLTGYNVAFETMLSRMASIDSNLAEVRVTTSDVDRRTSEMSISLTKIKQMVDNNGQSISYYRGELDEVKSSLNGNREKTAHLLGMVERIQANLTESAAGPD